MARTAPFVDSILHPTDFSKDGEVAFAHALALALSRRASLTLIHGGREAIGEDEWRRFPRVRKTLERWHLLDPGSERSDVFRKLSMRVEKVNAVGMTVLGPVLAYLERHPIDLLVVATEARDGLPRFLRPSKAERLARQAGTMTLFVPVGGRGFVDPATGELTLRRILVPVDREPDPNGALVSAGRAAAALGDDVVDITLLHVGRGPFPAHDLPPTERCRWEQQQRDGDPVDEILRAASEADLVAMVTEGRDGILDALRGTVTEQVVRRAPCPVLAVPSQ